MEYARKAVEKTKKIEKKSVRYQEGCWLLTFDIVSENEVNKNTEGLSG